MKIKLLKDPQFILKSLTISDYSLATVILKLQDMLACKKLNLGNTPK
jgi:hypothetical protein